jgi:hypothetical protein
MGQRQHERFRKDLTVKLHGTDRQGNPFSQTAPVVDISEKGLCLDSVHVLDRTGQIVTLEHKGAKACYRVVWVGVEKLAGQAGLAKVEPQSSIFKWNLPPSAPDSYEPPKSELSRFEDSLRKLMERRRKAERPADERRKYRRYECPGEVHVYQHGSDTPDLGRLTDLSIGGCFVEMLAPLAIGTKVGILLRVGQRRIRGEGIVTAPMPHFGVGIRFLHLEPEHLRQIEELVIALERGAPISAVVPAATAAAAAMSTAEAAVPDARCEILTLAQVEARVLDAVFGWFRGNDVLRREEFLALLRKAKTQAVADRLPSEKARNRKAGLTRTDVRCWHVCAHAEQMQAPNRWQGVGDEKPLTVSQGGSKHHPIRK